MNIAQCTPFRLLHHDTDRFGKPFIFPLHLLEQAHPVLCRVQGHFGLVPRLLQCFFLFLPRLLAQRIACDHV